MKVLEQASDHLQRQVSCIAGKFPVHPPVLPVELRAPKQRRVTVRWRALSSAHTLAPSKEILSGFGVSRPREMTPMTGWMQGR